MGLSKKGRLVYCADCGSRQEMNGVCRICGHIDNPILPGIVPQLVGLTQQLAEGLLTDPEAQLILGDVTTAFDETMLLDHIIASDPIADTELTIGSAVDILVSLGPEI